MPVRWHTEVFKIQGFICKRLLPSPPPPPLSYFGPRPNFTWAKYRSLVFLCSPTPRKRLLHRLHQSCNTGLHVSHDEMSQSNLFLLTVPFSSSVASDTDSVVLMSVDDNPKSSDVTPKGMHQQILLIVCDIHSLSTELMCIKLFLSHE